MDNTKPEIVEVSFPIVTVYTYYTVGGIKAVTFPSRPIPFKQKRMPIPFNRKLELNGRRSRRQMV